MKSLFKIILLLVLVIMCSPLLIPFTIFDKILNKIIGDSIHADRAKS